uniref:DNA binding protein n=1 Tax=Solanum tuberosum TaxID=4113 RepID=M1CU46_SOLTU
MNASDCSICLEVVTNNNSRSIAKLKCGHLFHLDCIGSEFNVGGLMRCPNCRDIEDGNWLFLQGEQSYAQYYEEEDETMLPEPMEVYFDPAVEVEANIPETIWTIEDANGGPMHVEDEPNLELTLALRNGPPLSPSRNVPPLRQNEQAAAGINLELSLATRYVPVPRPIIDLAVGTDLELSLAISNSTYGEQSSSSQIWLEDMMNMDDPDEEHDDETFRPNMIRFL